MNELTEMKNINSLINRPEEKDTEDGSFSNLNVKTWVDSLAVVYATSAAFIDNVANPGDFALAGKENLGSEIEMVVLDRRLHACYFNEATKKYTEHFYAKKDTEESWVRFISTCPANLKLNVGADLFVYLPQVKRCASWFMKSTLVGYVEEYWKLCAGGRIIKVKTNKQKNEKTGNMFFSLESTLTSKALAGSNLADVEQIPFNEADILPMLNIFQNEKGLETIETEDVER